MKPPNRVGNSMARYLFSCGYQIVGQSAKVSNGWVRCTVADRKSGEPRGVRWIRVKGEGGGFDVVKNDPNGGQRRLIVKDENGAVVPLGRLRACPVCEGPLLAAPEVSREGHCYSPRPDQGVLDCRFGAGTRAAS